MRAVLTHPKAGYYSQGDVFGEKGDFTTSPEISPLFGEMLGVWACHELRKIGSPRPMQYVELGPGRGTLAADILRAVRQLPPGAKDVSLHMVEVSEKLAQIQASRLGVEELTMLAESSPFYLKGTTEDGLEIFWHKTLRSVPRAFSFLVAHEFFDALPVHKFQKVDGQWREVLVSLKMPEVAEGQEEFELVLSRGSNPLYTALIQRNESREHLEICPEAAEIVGNMAERLEEAGGIALIIDYGHCGDKTDTFRAFKQHKLHDPLKDPGTADLTADVDFSFLLRAAGERVISAGPTPQGEFLKRVGIEERLNVLTSKLNLEQADNLRSSVKMVVEDMGSRFQCLALFPAVLSEHLQRFPVCGFQD